MRKCIRMDAAKTQRLNENSAAARRRSTKPKRVDPTTTDKQYTADELEFMNAMQAYKQRSGRNFPTWSEVLTVLRGLGYEKPVAVAAVAS